MANKSSSILLSSSSSSLLTNEEELAFEILSDYSDSVSDSGSWLVIDPSDSDNDDDVITTTDDDEEDEGVVPDVVDVLFQPYGSPASSDISVQSLLDEITNNHSQELENDIVVKHDVVTNGEDDLYVKEAFKIDNGRQVAGLMKGGDESYTVEVTEAYEVDYSCQIDGLMNGGDETYDEDEEEEEEEDELDDELVPKWLTNKFERQRMRKLGKKVYAKMKKSKRMVNQYNMPGCVRGKHGLGLKHNVIW